MFICETCASGKVDSFWFIISSISYGKCEYCGKTMPCLDIHHSKIKKEKEEVDK